MNFYHDPDAPIQPDQFDVEFTHMLEIYKDIEPARVLEIGVREGGSLCQWIKHAPIGATVAAIDLPWPALMGSGGTDWLTLMRFAKTCGVNLVYCPGDSHDIQTFRWAKMNGPYDFIFIDGDHSLRGVAADVLAYHQLVRSSGIIAMHDILPDRSDKDIKVYEYWERLNAAGLQTMTLTSGPGQESRGIGILYV